MDVSDIGMTPQVAGIMGSVISMLLAGNMFFIRSLVLKVEEVKQTVDQKIPVHQTEIQNMSNQIRDLDQKIQGITNDFKDLGGIRERLAVIEAMQQPKRRGSANKS